MSEATHDEGHHGAHTPAHYTRIYLYLLALLVVSVLGPMLEIQVVTLITAFGIACVKAFLVLKHFMHIDEAQRYVSYLVATGLVFMLLLFAGTSPDVMKPEGSNWVKPLWLEAPAAEGDLERGLPGHGGAEH